MIIKILLDFVFILKINCICFYFNQKLYMRKNMIAFKDFGFWDIIPNYFIMNFIPQARLLSIY